MEDMYGREISIEQSIIGSCKEVNLMRKGLKPKRPWAELKAILEKNSSKMNRRKDKCERLPCGREHNLDRLFYGKRRILSAQETIQENCK